MSFLCSTSDLGKWDFGLNHPTHTQREAPRISAPAAESWSAQMVAETGWTLLLPGLL